ncbi:diguanylate cyclase [Rhodobacteraceae bacterium]|nr:diguanylate cyclase [Paracoccaceae bacterium]
MRLRFPSLAKCAVLLLIGTLVVATHIVAQIEQRGQSMLADETLKQAKLVAIVTENAHAQYSESVYGAHQAGIASTIEEFPEPGEIHFPGTFTHLMSSQYTSTNPGVTYRLYSDDPFERASDRVLDTFQIAALVALRKNNSAEYWRIVPGTDTAQSVRYATPMRMQESCIACHNNPKWGLKRDDWRMGEVRGVFEVTVPITEGSLSSRSENATLFALVLLSSLLGIFVVYPVVNREVARRAHFESLSKNLTVLAGTDALSGLANRRVFEDALETASHMAASGDSRLGLIILDIDHFKQVNDTYGHDVGDAVITGFGEIIKANIRPGDVAARIGGEEFAVICPDVSPEELARISERIRAAVEAKSFKAEYNSFRITTSAGATMLDAEDDQRTFYRRADRLLFTAKQKGRNFVCVAP